MLWLAKLTAKTSVLILNLIWGFAQDLDPDFSHKILINVSDAQRMTGKKRAKITR